MRHALAAKRTASLKQSDLTRYAKALLAAGIVAFQVDVKPDGTVSIIAGGGKIIDAVNDWDRS